MTTWAAVEKDIENVVEEEGFFQNLEDDTPNIEIERMSTGLVLVDHILGGGMPRGRIIEVSGPESSGKTTFAIGMAAYQQRVNNAKVVLFDFEQASDLEYYRDGLGLSLKKPNLLFSQPTSMDQGFLALEKLIAADACDLLIWDTVAASRPMLELTKALDASQRAAVHAAEFGRFIQRMAAPIRKSRLTVLFVNQLRSAWGAYGSWDVTPGGRALKFYASIRLDIRKTGDMEKRKMEDTFLGTNKQEAYGADIKFRTNKNKTYRPFRECVVPIVYGHGYNNAGSVVDLAIRRKIIGQFGGGNYTIGEQKIKGKDKLCAMFEANPQALETLFDLLRKGGNVDSPECDAEAAGTDVGESTGDSSEA
jgi:recombination protein RecA